MYLWSYNLSSTLSINLTTIIFSLPIISNSSGDQLSIYILSHFSNNSRGTCSLQLLPYVYFKIFLLFVGISFVMQQQLMDFLSSVLFWGDPAFDVFGN